MKQELQIRQATLEDLPVCVAIINDYIDQTDWLPRTESREDMARYFTPDILQNRYFLIADLDQRACGYLSMEPNTGFIGGLYLEPDVRSHGVGKELLDAAKAFRPHGLHLTVYEPNKQAKRFYEREEFVESKEERNDNTEFGVPTLMMRWEASHYA